MQRIEPSNYDFDKPREEYISDMEAEGYLIVYPKENELQIDIDTIDQLQVFERMWEVIDHQIPEASYEQWQSKSGEGFHILVTLPFEVSNIERIALQASLGSDPLRELLSIFRYSRDDAYPTLFVERKDL